MSAMSDALAALKNIVLLQERLDVLQRDVGRLSTSVTNLDGFARDIDRRVIRIEAMIEMGRGGGGGGDPRIGN